MSFFNRKRQYLVGSVILLLLGTWPSCAEEPVRLTTDGRLKATPVFMRGGTELVFAVLENPKMFRLMTMRLADRSVEPLRQEATMAEFEPACSRDGRYCAFVRQRGVLSLSVAILDKQSNTLVEVLPPPGFAGLRSPTFSPDNSRVLYSFADENRQQIFSTNLQATDPQKLTDSLGINNWPNCSPDGKEIVFSSSRDGNFEIYLMQCDGSNAQRLTHNPLQDIRPRFSPDGKRIVFVGHRDGNSEIYVMDRDGTNLARVTHHPERDDYPDWHTDGKRLVVVSERGGRHDLYLVSVP
jgi:tricorn protease-like protein